MIKKIVDYVTSKVKDLDIVESKSTSSIYIHLKRYRIRIADHIGVLNPETKVQVIIPEESSKFIVCIGLKIYLYSTFKQVVDFLINYIRIHNNIILSEYEDKKLKVKELNDVATGLRQQLVGTNQLKSDLQSCLDKYETLKGQYQATTTKQAMLKAELKEKDAAIKEAAELIQELYSPETRALIYSEKRDKRYYLDNFSDEAKEMIEELIKDYYSK